MKTRFVNADDLIGLEPMTVWHNGSLYHGGNSPDGIEIVRLEIGVERKLASLPVINGIDKEWKMTVYDNHTKLYNTYNIYTQYGHYLGSASFYIQVTNSSFWGENWKNCAASMMIVYEDYASADTSAMYDLRPYLETVFADWLAGAFDADNDY